MDRDRDVDRVAGTARWLEGTGPMHPGGDSMLAAPVARLELQYTAMCFVPDAQVASSFASSPRG